MSTYSVRDAFQLLKERGIARDKQEVRKWLNNGYIRAEPPINRRVGWQIETEALDDFIRKFEEGVFEDLKRRRLSPLREAGRPLGAGSRPRSAGAAVVPLDPHLVRLEEEVLQLRQTVRSMRRELNDLKKVLGFPLLKTAGEKTEEQ